MSLGDGTVSLSGVGSGDGTGEAALAPGLGCTGSSGMGMLYFMERKVCGGFVVLLLMRPAGEPFPVELQQQKGKQYICTDHPIHADMMTDPGLDTGLTVKNKFNMITEIKEPVHSLIHSLNYLKS